ncbi:(d)CMP kinase [Albibacterium bauzanense]|uniref:Cytidylate kinase n=1 Tax=Albibacterium bauzanense TaxID=653929 RepID=A0A4R1M2D4_9SPHI|nr:(d)CMP kinase [Albibacterium bauzanense]TCK85170.1 cytidylate kinase [Albibacterium bauzanense]
MDKRNIIIAIDGYSSCGKSTVAKALANKLNYIYIDSGAMYRALTLYLIEHHISANDIEKIKSHLSDIEIKFDLKDDKTIVLLNGKDVTSKIREMNVSELVSEVSSIKEVRKAMVVQQQKMAENQNIVMDGRDIGTVVFPNAQVKIFMMADPKVRADRRFKELQLAGKNVTLEEVFENLAHRDYQDTTRKESPLTRSEEAIVLDNTNLNQEQQLDFVINEVKKVLSPKK